MPPRDKALLQMTAADLMSPPSVLVPEDMSLQAAARLLSKAQVSGAPVVNADGLCVGILSATDFLRRTEKGRVPAPERPISAAWQIVDTDSLPAEAVFHHMTRDPVTVAASTPLGELARMMLDAHIHRLIVVGADCRPAGVVSTIDILAALARTAALVERARAETCAC